MRVTDQSPIPLEEKFPIPDNIREVIDLLTQVPEERAYLVASWRDRMAGPDIKRDANRAFQTAARNLRRVLSPEDPMADKVIDRMTGLDLAFGEMDNLMGDPKLEKLPHYKETLQAHTVGLVDAKTKIAVDFRARVTGSPLPPPTPSLIP